MNRIIRFEIQAADPERTAKFYRNVFGWEIHEWVIPGVRIVDENRYWLVATGPATEPGINGGMFSGGEMDLSMGRQRPGSSVSSGLQSWTTVGKVVEAGGSIILARMPVGGIGWWASCRDTEGNFFGMMQEDQKAG